METDIAVIKQRMDDHEKNNQELFDDLKTIIKKNSETLERIEKTGQDTNIQATKTNGRVTNLEEWRLRATPDIAMLVRFRWMLLGGMILVTTVGTVFFFIASRWIIAEVARFKLEVGEQINESTREIKQYTDDKLSEYEIPTIETY